MYIAAIDFKKAFDFVSRDKLILAMIHYKIDSKIIECVKEIYSKDKTRIRVNDNKEIDMEITNGIKQGCTRSTTLFKLITYMILEKLQRNGGGYSDSQVRLNTLFFADDGLQMSTSREEAENNIKDLIEASESCGLELNKEKSSFVLFNVKEDIKEIEGLNLTHKIKYLGININNQKDCFKEHRKEVIQKAEKMANMTYSIILRSCNKLLIGKTYWKSVVMPMLLHGTSVIDFTKEEIRKVQSVENSVYRTILGARRYTAEEGIRGEVGASLFETRLMKNRLAYIQSIIKGGRNELVEKIMKNTIRCRADAWATYSMDVLEKVGISIHRVERITRRELEECLREWDTRRWSEGMDKKTSLQLYRQHKKKIGEVDHMYDNRPASTLLFQARTNSLPLGNCIYFLRGGDNKCPVCGGEKEDLEHFLLYCEGYSEERKQLCKLQQPYNQDKEQIIKNVLYELENKRDVENTKTTIQKFWKIREKKLNKIMKEIATTN